MDEILNVIYSGLLTVGISVLGFFIKRCFNDMDKKADKTDVEKCTEDVKEFRSIYATKEEVKEIRAQMNDMRESIEFLKENTVRKNDFVRVTTEISGKLDDLNTFLRGKLL